MTSSEKDSKRPEASEPPPQKQRVATDEFPFLARGTGSVNPIKPAVVVLAIVGNAENYAAALEWIRRRGIVVETAASGEDGLRLHREQGADLVLIGLPLPDHGASSIIGGVRSQDPRATIVVVGKDGEVSSQLAALELGAQEYVADPVDGRRDLLFALGVSLGVRHSDAHYRVLRQREASTADWRKIVAGCPAMIEVMKRMRELCEWTLSGATPTVLLTGARGTGKHLLARALHYNGARRNRAFVEVNCAAQPPDVLRAELFGEARGGVRQGLLEIADGGTVFLDEIDAVPLGIQRDLLTAIEGRQICRVGSEEPIYLDVQFVAGTRGDLATIVKRSEFRPDLYHRLSVRTIALPQLRDRGADIIAIAEAMLAELAIQYGIRVPQLHDEAVLALLRHAWPGNLHELRNELEHVVLHVGESTIRTAHFRFQQGVGAVAADTRGNQLTVTLSGDSCPLERLEREVIRQGLERNGGNVSRTARFLGITRQTLLYRLKKYRLRVPEEG